MRCRRKVFTNFSSSIRIPQWASGDTKSRDGGGEETSKPQSVKK
jgi:hypothetical protein